jgi:hypothetical protein
MLVIMLTRMVKVIHRRARVPWVYLTMHIPASSSLLVLGACMGLCLGWVQVVVDQKQVVEGSYSSSSRATDGVRTPRRAPKQGPSRARLVDTFVRVQVQLVVDQNPPKLT